MQKRTMSTVFKTLKRTQLTNKTMTIARLIRKREREREREREKVKKKKCFFN